MIYSMNRKMNEVIFISKFHVMYLSLEATMDKLIQTFT